MPQEPDDSQWWLDDQVWLDLFATTFHEDAAKAELAARLFHRLLAQIESGPMGVTRAAICIENALRLTFPFTETYHVCRILFQISLGDSLPTDLDAMERLIEAMKRTKAVLAGC